MGEAICKNNKCTYDEFICLRENSEDKIEYIDDIIYMSPAPMPKHQDICFEISRRFYEFLNGSKCKMLQGINLRLYDENKNKIGDVIPDISIFCDYNDISNTFIEEIPLIIVEIVSPSSIFIDNIKKTDLYKRVGVSEYWIVNLSNKTITIWNFRSNEQFVYKGNELVCSTIFHQFSIELQELFT